MLLLFNFPFMGGSTTKTSENLGQNLNKEYMESQMYSDGQCSYYASIYLHTKRTEKVFSQFKEWAIENEKRGGRYTPTAKEKIDELLKDALEIEVKKPINKASVGRSFESKGYGNNRGSHAKNSML